MTYGLAALAAGYLLGGFPTAYLLARARGRDVFAVGSGSMGAMNTARNVSPALGAAVLVVDAAKGALAAYLGALLGGLGAGPGPLLGSLLGSLGAVTGHCFSPFVGFRGGKGLATAFGALLVVHPAPALYGLALLAVLALAAQIGGKAPPALLLSVEGESFDFGEIPTPSCALRIREAAEAFKRWFRQKYPRSGCSNGAQTGI